MSEEVDNTIGFMSERGLTANNLMLDSVAVETLGMAMHNSVTHQQQVNMLNIANLAATCKQLLETSYEPSVNDATCAELPAPSTVGSASNEG